MSQLSSLSFRPYYGSLSFSVNRTPSFCRFNLPFRCPISSNGILIPDCWLSPHRTRESSSLLWNHSWS
ncbi:hypothetical protein ABKV19_004231 [Rosa sericea]